MDKPKEVKDLESIIFWEDPDEPEWVRAFKKIASKDLVDKKNDEGNENNNRI